MEGVFRNSQDWRREEGAGPDHYQPSRSPPPPHLKEPRGRLKEDPVLQAEKQDRSNFPTLSLTVRDAGHSGTYFSSKAEVSSYTPLPYLSSEILILHPLAFIGYLINSYTRPQVCDFFCGNMDPGTHLKAPKVYKVLR